MFATSFRLAISLIVISLVGCHQGIRLDDAGARIRVAKDAQQVDGCTLKGEITTSVKDKIAFVSRERARVADELETLARNQASELGADTILANTAVEDGEQQFNAYSCKS